MRTITQYEFKQGVAFTTKETKFLYSSLKYVNGTLYCVNIDYSPSPRQYEYSVKNITNTSFDIQTLFFDSIDNKTVFLGSCFAIENQPKEQGK